MISTTWISHVKKEKGSPRESNQDIYIYIKKLPISPFLSFLPLILCPPYNSSKTKKKNSPYRRKLWEQQEKNGANVQLYVFRKRKGPHDGWAL